MSDERKTTEATGRQPEKPTEPQDPLRVPSGGADYARQMQLGLQMLERRQELYRMLAET